MIRQCPRPDCGGQLVEEDDYLDCFLCARHFTLDGVEIVPRPLPRRARLKRQARYRQPLPYHEAHHDPAFAALVRFLGEVGE